MEVSPLFQFHKGTIKTSLVYCFASDGLSFQFHKGTIKTFDAVLPRASEQISIP